MLVKVTEYNFRTAALRWQMLKSTNTIFTFFIFSKVQPVETKGEDTHKQTYRHRHRNHSNRRNLADFSKIGKADFCKYI